MFITIWTLLQLHHIEETKDNVKENNYFSNLNRTDLDKIIMIYNGIQITITIKEAKNKPQF